MSRSGPCQKCGQNPLYFECVDCFGCLECDRWTEPPHSCSRIYGGCDSGFSDAPASPSQYHGRVLYPPNYEPRG